jgi:molecular chaperone DnaK (HSP70)
MAWQTHGEDLAPEDIESGVIPIPQLVASGTVESREQLPSFMYFPADVEYAEGELALPWADGATEGPSQVVGELARRAGIKTPGRWLASAKSWLCHGGIDRQSPILPLDPLEGVSQVSPVAASKAYLAHLAKAWHHHFPEQSLSDQQVVVTIPASFDPAARELTAHAVEGVGISNYTLLEEPQAALYAWLGAHPNWRDEVAVGDVLLVVDVGGGTTDLSLIQVQDQDGQLALERIAVGNHILLGGDNMDLALAYAVKQSLEQSGKKLERWQITALTQSCREAKELLLSDDSLESAPVTVPGRGSKLLGNTLRAELDRGVLNQVLLEGFFPTCQITDHPRAATRGALVEKGLPYAQDAGITRHLAQFLTQHAPEDSVSGFIQPQKILLNGGVFKSPLLAERLFTVVQSWLVPYEAQVTVLDGADLDLAVARGAAFFGQTHVGKGVRIRSGLASSYYIGVESAMPAIPGFEPPMQAVCIAPFGLETGSEVALSEREFHLVVGEPVSFRFFGSTVRKQDPLATVLEDWSEDELLELPPIQVTLAAEQFAPGEAVPVSLAARLTEVGTLEIEAISRSGTERWQVALEVRDNTR